MLEKFSKLFPYTREENKKSMYSNLTLTIISNKQILNIIFYQTNFVLSDNCLFLSNVPG